MLSAAYALLELEQADGAVTLGEDLLEPKGELRVESLRVGDHTWAEQGAMLTQARPAV